MRSIELDGLELQNHIKFAHLLEVVLAMEIVNVEAVELVVTDDEV